MAGFDFDRPLDRRNPADSVKWLYRGTDVLPMWIADMEFAAPDAVVDAMAERLRHPVFGYAMADTETRQAVVDWVQTHYDWAIRPEDIVFLPGTLPGIAMGLLSTLSPGDGVVMQTPIYGPIHKAPGLCGMRRIDAPIGIRPDGCTIGSFADEARHARAMLLCNPHNPTGKVYSRAELALLAEAAERHDLLILSDEVHCDLVFPGHRHIPVATLDEQTAARTITLMSGGKTFNISGLKLAFAIIQNADLRHRFQASKRGMVPATDNLMGLVATRAAFRHAEEWRQALVGYLAENAAHLERRLATELPAAMLVRPEASFLAWIDCRALGLDEEPSRFFERHAALALYAGTDFGPGGDGWVRLNFGCPRAMLDEAIDRMVASAAGHASAKG